MNSNHLEPIQLEQLRLLDSCSVANAIETFGVRLRNTGFTDSTIHCIFPEFPPIAGYAATARIRTSEAPMEGDRYYYRLDWLEHVLSIPAPRILVLQDMDPHPGLGAFIGDVHANILLALECAGVVTNGAVRNVSDAHEIKFQMYAGNLSVSHAFAHIVDFGTPVEVGRMQVQPGDLLHGDRHGIQTVPFGIADKVPGVARKMIEQEKELIQLSRSGEFTMKRLRAEVAVLSTKQKALRT